MANNEPGLTRREGPIIMSGTNVVATMAGRKTNTRRIVKDPAKPSRFRAGMRLWVRETCYIAPPGFGDVDLCAKKDADGRPRMLTYATDCDGEAPGWYGIKKTPSIFMPRWASRITLEVAEVRRERLQDISEEDAIAEGIEWVMDSNCGEPVAQSWPVFRDYFAPEGTYYFTYPRLSFTTLWESINGPGSWEANPLVDVIKFKVVTTDGTN